MKTNLRALGLFCLSALLFISACSSDGDSGAPDVDGDDTPGADGDIVESDDAGGSQWVFILVALRMVHHCSQKNEEYNTHSMQW